MVDIVKRKAKLLINCLTARECYCLSVRSWQECFYGKVRQAAGCPKQQAHLGARNAAIMG